MNKQGSKVMIIGFIIMIIMTYANYYSLNKIIVEKTDLILEESRMTQYFISNKCIPLTKVSDGVYKSQLHETVECSVTIMIVSHCCMP